MEENERTGIQLGNASSEPDLMLIGEVALKTGLTVRTVRYYEELDLVKPVTRTDGGFRLYDDSALRRLRLIQALRDLDFQLKDIRGLIRLRSERSAKLRGTRKLREALQTQMNEANRQIAQFLALRADIQRAMSLAAECGGYAHELPTLSAQKNERLPAFSEEEAASFANDDLTPILPVEYQARL